MKILAVEDEVTLSESIQEYLRNESYECDSVSSFQEGVKQIESNPYDCILLDIPLYPFPKNRDETCGLDLNLDKLLQRKRLRPFREKTFNAAPYFAEQF